jgi:hypothetical protein
MGTQIPVEGLLLGMDGVTPKGVLGAVRFGGRLTFYWVTPRPPAFDPAKGVEMAAVLFGGAPAPFQRVLG